MVGAYKVYGIPPRKRIFPRIFSINTKILFVNLFCFFIFTIFLAKNPSLIDFIALKPSNIFQGQYLWTFLTSMFMHVPGPSGFGILSFHLFANMLSLLFIGGLVERILGARRYLWFYLISGLFAGLFFVLFSLVFKGDFNTYAVGASGALFGLVGFLMIITPNLPVYIMFIPIPIKMKYAAPGILIVLWLISLGANIGIGNTAHLGGLIAGLIYGIYLKNKYKNKTRMISHYFS